LIAADEPSAALAAELVNQLIVAIYQDEAVAWLVAAFSVATAVVVQLAARFHRSALWRWFAYDAIAFKQDFPWLTCALAGRLVAGKVIWTREIAFSARPRQSDVWRAHTHAVDTSFSARAFRFTAAPALAFNAFVRENDSWIGVAASPTSATVVQIVTEIDAAF
jgi:hypothetical protein